MEKAMRSSTNLFRILVCLVLVGILGGCAVGPTGPYYSVSQNHTENDGPFRLGPNDQYYVMQIDDRSPFGLHRLPQTEDMLYNKGYDRVRKEKSADFSIDVAFSGGVQENPELRAGHTIGGALLGAATGAAIGAAVGDPGAGAAIGAAGGGALGLVAPAATGVVRIDISVYSFNERTTSQKSTTVDLAHVPPHDLHHVIDNEVTRTLHGLPRR